MVHSNRKKMFKMKGDKCICGDHHNKYCKNIACMKWTSNHSVLITGSFVENIGFISSVSRREKGSTTKRFVNCPEAIKIHNAKVGFQLIS